MCGFVDGNDIKHRRRIFLYGFLIVSFIGAASYYLIWRRRHKNTDYQNYLINLNNLIHNRISKNKNSYLSNLFLSFNDDIPENKAAFEKIKQKKLAKKPVQSDPLLPPFEIGVFIADLSQSHSLIFDIDPKVRAQMMIITKDFEYQNLLITPRDIEAWLRFIKATEGFVLYSSNEKVGAKHNHKHIYACLHDIYMPMLEAYSGAIENRRNTINKFTETITAKINEISKFDYILCGFEKVTKSRKDISLNVHNMRERAKNIHSLYLEHMNRLKMIKRSYKATYVMLMTEDWMLLVKNPHQVIPVNDFDPFTFVGLGQFAANPQQN